MSTICIHTELPTKNKFVKTSQTFKTWFLVSSPLNWEFWWLSTEINQFWPTRKWSKQIPYNRLWSLILCGKPCNSVALRYLARQNRTVHLLEIHPPPRPLYILPSPLPNSPPLYPLPSKFAWIITRIVCNLQSNNVAITCCRFKRRGTKY